MPSSRESTFIAKELVVVDAKNVDVVARLIHSEKDTDLDPIEAARIRQAPYLLQFILTFFSRRKIDTHLLPLMCIIYGVQFIDKITLGTTAIMGIIESNHLSTNQFNWLGTVFYIGYLVFEFPQSYCLQRFPVGKWLSANILVWAVALSCHAACTSFGGLLVVRLILGAAEGSITGGFLLISMMFYTRAEHLERVGYWYGSIGVAGIISSFIGYGVLHITNSALKPWQWFMIITGGITLMCGLVFLFVFPDSPTTAWFLTPQERVVAVKRIQVEQTGIENKTFKKEQLIEALCDPKIWLFSIYSGITFISGSLTSQRNLIVARFGYTRIQNILLGCVDGVLITLCIIAASFAARRIPNGRAYVAAAFYIPTILGVVLLNVLKAEDKIGLMFAYWLTIPSAGAFVVVLSWASSVITGHTKRSISNGMMLSGFCIGYGSGQFLWQKKYLPRNHVPWTIIGCCFGVCIIIILAVRHMLLLENQARDKRHSEPVDDPYAHVYVEYEMSDGVKEMVKVEKALLDLTDIQNQDFRYVL